MKGVARLKEINVCHTCCMRFFLSTVNIINHVENWFCFWTITSNIYCNIKLWYTLLLRKHWFQYLSVLNLPPLICHILRNKFHSYVWWENVSSREKKACLLVSHFPSTCNFDWCALIFSLVYTYTTCFGLIGHLHVYKVVFQGNCYCTTIEGKGQPPSSVFSLQREMDWLDHICLTTLPFIFFLLDWIKDAVYWNVLGGQSCSGCVCYPLVDWNWRQLWCLLDHSHSPHWISIKFSSYVFSFIHEHRYGRIMCISGVRLVCYAIYILLMKAKWTCLLLMLCSWMFGPGIATDIGISAPTTFKNPPLFLLIRSHFGSPWTTPLLLYMKA
jgi:hypothetical protein